MAPKGSGEECGRKSESLCSVTDLLSGWSLYVSAGLHFSLIHHDRPHSSSVMEIALGDFHDSFSPGEAISRCARDRSGGRYRGTVITVPNATEGHRGPGNIDTQILSTGLEEFVEKRGKNKE